MFIEQNWEIVDELEADELEWRLQKRRITTSGRLPWLAKERRAVPSRASKKEIIEAQSEPGRQGV